MKTRAVTINFPADATDAEIAQALHAGESAARQFQMNSSLRTQDPNTRRYIWAGIANALKDAQA